LRNDQSKSEQPENFKCTVFLDRTHGKEFGALLRRVGFDVKSIFRVYPKKKHETTSDPTWIKKCGAEDWIAISGDKRIETNVENRKAVIDAKAKVFILSDSNSRPEEWAAAVICGKDKFRNLIRKNQGPFFASIGKQAQTHIANIRFPTLKSERASEQETKQSQPSSSEFQGSGDGHPEGQAGTKEEKYSSE